MNKTEEMWYKHYKECNDIDYAQIERFDTKVQEEILRTKALIDIIAKEEDRINQLIGETLEYKNLNQWYITRNAELKENLAETDRENDRLHNIIESFESGEMKVGKHAL